MNIAIAYTRYIKDKYTFVIPITGILLFQVKRVIIELLEEHRGFVIVLFCLPASFLFDQTFKLWKLFYLKFCSAPEQHDENVRSVQRKVSRHFLVYRSIMSYALVSAYGYGRDAMILTCVVYCENVASKSMVSNNPSLLAMRLCHDRISNISLVRCS